MKVFELRREIDIPAELGTVFSFFSTPENLAAITPASVGFQVLTPSPIRMGEGAVFDYVVRAMGVPVRWTTLITEFSSPRKFVDIQLKGPCSFWHHTHEFSELPDGKTRMGDHVRYVLPFGPLGALMAPVVKRQLDHIFDYRARAIAERFPVRPA